LPIVRIGNTDFCGAKIRNNAVFDGLSENLLTFAAIKKGY
jgi:hypothetical protein